MADNLRNPLKGAETDMTKATSAISGLLNPSEEETIGQTEPPKQETQQQNSPEPQNEESSTEEQPQELRFKRHKKIPPTR